MDSRISYSNNNLQKSFLLNYSFWLKRVCFNLVTYTKVKNIFKLFISEFGGGVN